jgi:hypothetical protein
MDEREKKEAPKDEKRRKYEPPQVITEEVFERQALACGAKTVVACEHPPVSHVGS